MAGLADRINYDHAKKHTHDGLDTDRIDFSDLSGVVPAHASRHVESGADPLGHTRLLGYTESTASQTGIAALTDLTGLSVTVNVTSGRRIKVTAWIVALGNGADPGDSGQLRIREGGTTLQEIPFNTDASNRPQFVHGFVYLTPTAGAHTYKLSLERTVGAANMETQHTATQIGYIQVEDVGV